VYFQDHFEHCVSVDDVETGIVLDRLDDHFFVNEEFTLQCCHKRSNVFGAHSGDNVRILSGAYHAIQRAGKRAANEIGDAKFFENIRCS